ncbi:tyrosine-type recombinase/integrase [Arcobacter aquimarinus]|uniref:tyrosine-type recombinase/integrase n=1 Tax=Arcobacter aquimarinus TaxID=1315211 RepID=UPI003BAFC591
MIKTSHKGIFYTVSKVTNKKTYYGRYTDNKGKQKKVNLGNSLTIAAKKFELIKKDSNIDIENHFSKKLDNAFSEMLFINAYNNYEKVEFKKWSEHEQVTKKSRFRKWILPVFGSKKIHKINYSDIQNFINYLDEQNSLGAIKCARKTQENIKSSIQSFFTFLKKEGLLKRDNPAQHVTIKPYDNHVPMTLTIEQITFFYKNIFDIDISNLENRKKRLMLILMIHGRRWGEAKNLCFSEIDFVKNNYIIPSHKSKDKKTHYHQMTNLLRNEFLEFKNLSKENDFIFINPKTNKPYETISKFFKKIKIDSNIPTSFRCQDFRHVVGTVARNSLGLPLEDIRDVLGHGSVKTTEIYSDKDSHNSKIVINKLFELFDL